MRISSAQRLAYPLSAAFHCALIAALAFGFLRGPDWIIDLPSGKLIAARAASPASIGTPRREYVLVEANDPASPSTPDSTKSPLNTSRALPAETPPVEPRSLSGLRRARLSLEARRPTRDTRLPERTREAAPRDTPRAARTVPRQVLAEVAEPSGSSAAAPERRPAIASERVLAVSGGRSEIGIGADELPQKLSANARPIYPPEELSQGIEGYVVVKAWIATDGSVTRVAVEKSSGRPNLDASALTAVSGWRFTPGRNSGSPVACEVLVPVRFSIRRG